MSTDVRMLPPQLAAAPANFKRSNTANRLKENLEQMKARAATAKKGRKLRMDESFARHALTKQTLDAAFDLYPSMRADHRDSLGKNISSMLDEVMASEAKSNIVQPKKLSPLATLETLLKPAAPSAAPKGECPSPKQHPLPQSSSEASLSRPILAQGKFSEGFMSSMPDLNKSMSLSPTSATLRLRTSSRGQVRYRPSPSPSGNTPPPAPPSEESWKIREESKKKRRAAKKKKEEAISAESREIMRTYLSKAATHLREEKKRSRVQAEDHSVYRAVVIAGDGGDIRIPKVTIKRTRSYKKRCQKAQDFNASIADFGEQTTATMKASFWAAKVKRDIKAINGNNRWWRPKFQP